MPYLVPSHLFVKTVVGFCVPSLQSFSSETRNCSRVLCSQVAVEDAPERNLLPSLRLTQFAFSARLTLRSLVASIRALLMAVFEVSLKTPGIPARSARTQRWRRNGIDLSSDGGPSADLSVPVTVPLTVRWWEQQYFPCKGHTAYRSKH